MGQAFVVDTQQSGPRGGDKFYSSNVLMAAAGHSAGRGSFLIQLMLSLEPATITNRVYPELFQTGETAFGRTITNGQHPHNFIMGLGFHYARPLGEGTILEAYFAPVGDPARWDRWRIRIGHRLPNSKPQAPLSHHWQDSTHISDDVVAVGLKHRWLRLEASGFHGSEPGENRWTIEQGAIDSWSTRVSVFATKNWMAQASVGRIARPERQEPGDVLRSTASLHYSRPVLGSESWSSSFIWGRNHDTFTHHNLNSYLAETVLPVAGRNFLTARAELVDKDELFADTPQFGGGARPHGPDRPSASERTRQGLTHDLAASLHGVETGIGANFSAYAVPSSIRPYYGNHPFGVNIFLRLRLKPSH